MHFVAGSRIGARGMVWDLVEAEQLGAQQRLRLRCAGGDLRGLEWDVLYPAEAVQALRSELRPEAPAPLNAWRLYQTACVLEQLPGGSDPLASDPGRVTIEPYQLVPLMRALELPRPRLLLADGVGLGKTVQAGLIATELIARRRAHRVLVVVPAGPLLVQWEQELRHRFGLRFTPLTDSAALQRERRRVELGGNPFDSIALCLVALDFAKQERVLEELERAAWDLAIIDEAHHCIGGVTDTEATLRRRLAEVIAARSDGLLLLTATPHDGHDAHFASLIALLDPCLVDGSGGLAGMAYRRHVVRRLKSHIRDPDTGAPLFRQRQVIPVRIAARPAEAVQVFHAGLGALVAPRLQRTRLVRDETDALAFISLLKRSVSTIHACTATLRVVAERYRAMRADTRDAAALRRERARALRAYRRRSREFGVLDTAAENAAAELEVEEMAADLCRLDATMPEQQYDGTVTALDALIRAGEAAAPCDPKLAALLDEVRSIRAAHPGANILIYTEYADSQSAAVHALRRAADISGDVLAISGSDPEAERTRAAERFAEQDTLILVSTDSLAEGLNLHRRCFHLVHLDLPYNPNRLEQRNGRIDRYGQTREPEIRYLYLAGTFEERLLLRLIAKYEKARARLDVMPDTLGVTADEADWNKGLAAGFAEDQATLFQDDAPLIRTLDTTAETGSAAAYRDLLHEIDRAFAGFERHALRHGWLAEQGLNADLRLMRAVGAARRRGAAVAGGIELGAFVADAIAADDPACGGSETRPDGGGDRLLHLPFDWSIGLENLPGYDPAGRMLRVTRDPDRLHNAQGETLSYLGRAHPLVARAIGRVQRSEIADAAGSHDPRVSAARTSGGSPAVLLTFAMELVSERWTEQYRIIAVLLPQDGRAVLAGDPVQWLRFAAPDRSVGLDGVWQRHFATWVPQRHTEARQCAAAAMQDFARDAAETQRNNAARDRAEAERWLDLRATEICGPWQPATADLFGATPCGPVWQRLRPPLDRLAAYAADADNAPAKRREANSVVALVQRRTRERDRSLALCPPVLRPLGMLMLVPDGAAA